MAVAAGGTNIPARPAAPAPATPARPARPARPAVPAAPAVPDRPAGSCDSSCFARCMSEPFRGIPFTSVMYCTEYDL